MTAGSTPVCIWSATAMTFLSLAQPAAHKRAATTITNAARELITRIDMMSRSFCRREATAENDPVARRLAIISRGGQASPKSVVATDTKGNASRVDGAKKNNLIVSE